MFKSLNQWYSTESNFGPQGTFGNVWRHFFITTSGTILVGRGQVVVNIFQCAPDPNDKELLAANVSSAVVSLMITPTYHFEFSYCST